MLADIRNVVRQHEAAIKLWELMTFWSRIQELLVKGSRWSKHWSIWTNMHRTSNEQREAKKGNIMIILVLKDQADLNFNIMSWFLTVHLNLNNPSCYRHMTNRKFRKDKLHTNPISNHLNMWWTRFQTSNMFSLARKLLYEITFKIKPIKEHFHDHLHPPMRNKQNQKAL